METIRLTMAQALVRWLTAQKTEIDGQVVRGGPGWVVISARDLARWGLLVATGGEWNGERLIGRVQGHGGGNGSDVGGNRGQTIGSWGKVTTNFNHGSVPWRLFTAVPRPE